MNFCNNQKFLKLSKINKYLLQIFKNKQVEIFLLSCGRTMLVAGGAMWENGRGDGKSLVRADAVVIDFRTIKL
jgi:hypothetical protein